MSIIKYAAGIPAVGAVIASLYGALQYVNNLQNTTESNKQTIVELKMEDKTINKDLANQVEKLVIRLKAVENLYKQGSERMLIEMTAMAGEIAENRAKANTLRDQSFKTASEAELQALENSYYKLQDEIRQFKYDLKEIERKITDGGY
jgi:Cdc6-like AAA superfamily ATPase|tara:strand:- start:246 stop:689 length:444 start_codon:yes stop_codon:yes gene_type:complete